MQRASEITPVSSDPCPADLIETLPLQVLPTPDLCQKAHQELQFPKDFPSSSCRLGFVPTAPVAAQISLFPGAPGPWHLVLPAGSGLPGLKNHALVLLPLSSPNEDQESQVSGSVLQNSVVGQDPALPGLDKRDHCKSPARCNA